jgi:hypothetical protein
MKMRGLGTLPPLALAAAIVSGCASSPSPPSSPAQQPVPADTPSPAQPAVPANVNLRGYPPAFREGYAAGCVSRREGGRRRDEGRYKADANYQMGWDDGYSICVSRK